MLIFDIQTTYYLVTSILQMKSIYHNFFSLQTLKTFKTCYIELSIFTSDCVETPTEAPPSTSTVTQNSNPQVVSNHLLHFNFWKVFFFFVISIMFSTCKLLMTVKFLIMYWCIIDFKILHLHKTSWPHVALYFFCSFCTTHDYNGNVRFCTQITVN